MIFPKMYYLHFPFTRLNPPAEGKKTRTELVHRTNNARKIDEWQPAVMKGPSDALKTRRAMYSFAVVYFLMPLFPLGTAASGALCSLGSRKREARKAAHILGMIFPSLRVAFFIRAFFPLS